MKKLFYLILLVTLSSCSDELIDKDYSSSLDGKNSEMFSFDKITEPAAWAQHQSLEEMLAACQIPEDKLKSCSTKDLIKICFDHPLYALYYAYNNELEGASVVIKNFNGFSELQKRSDAASELLSFYEDVSLDPQSVVVSKQKSKFSKMSHLGFVELYIATKDLSQLYDKATLSRLKEISNKVLESKLTSTKPKLSAIRHSLLINAQVKLSEGDVSKEDESMLTSFVNAGGNVENSKELTVISKIVSQ